MEIPKRVFIQFFDEDGEENPEPTWTSERLYESDVEYIQVRKD